MSGPARLPQISMRRALSDAALLGSVLAGESWAAWRWTTSPGISAHETKRDAGAQQQ
jgi:hypothetical protein